MGAVLLVCGVCISVNKGAEGSLIELEVRIDGKFVINDKNMEEYFGGHSRSKWIVMRPFEVAKLGTQYDIWVDVLGGGVNGQAGAISHGVARAFSKLENTMRIAMRKEGLLTRDSRMVERKKSGQPKARKRFQYSKR